jgi:hypothetical protein
VVHPNLSSADGEIEMNSEVQMVILVPQALAAACAKVAREKMTSRSCWVRQTLVDALKREAQQDAA